MSFRGPDAGGAGRRPFGSALSVRGDAGGVSAAAFPAAAMLQAAKSAAVGSAANAEPTVSVVTRATPPASLLIWVMIRGVIS